jgi:formylmethanofuran dehydrogenase subunit E
VTPWNLIEIYRLFGKIAAVFNRRLPRSASGTAQECEPDYSPNCVTDVTRLIGGTRRREERKRKDEDTEENSEENSNQNLFTERAIVKSVTFYGP